MSAPLVSHVFTALADGPRLLVMAALHGNEQQGTAGLQRVLAALHANPSMIVRGSVTILPVASPAAFARNIRYLDQNPNRIFCRSADDRYEGQLVNRLADLIDRCDVLLDIHGYTAPPSKPFLFLDLLDDGHTAFARALGLPTIITGWQDLVGSAQDSNAYAHAQGKRAVTVETGQNDDPAGADVAEAATWRALAGLGLIDRLPSHVPPPPVPAWLQLQTRWVKDRPGTLVPDLQHLQPVSAGQRLASFDDGAAIMAPADAVLIMPKYDARLGDEWFYLAGAIPDPAAT